MESIKLSIAKDFTPTPGSRYIKEGEFSGELFRQNILFPAFKNALEHKTKLIVNLDGTAGYGTSFLEEAFGGLIREEKMLYKDVTEGLQLISNEEDYLIEDIFQYLKDAENHRLNEQKTKQAAN